MNLFKSLSDLIISAEIIEDNEVCELDFLNSIDSFGFVSNRNELLFTPLLLLLLLNSDP